MLTRTENGRLFLDRVKFETILNKLFSNCKNKKEIEWLESQIKISIDVTFMERIEEIKRG